ncbi:AraC family transcriptional regulator [Falsihalocynthiibacter sp. SS001]|uniref:AraC family transcriptional regulator n=1 Tax=Falsihalocynthiibacter sp. SS001 TaxID=3349698 RepID=UPI0036D44065
MTQETPLQSTPNSLSAYVTMPSATPLRRTKSAPPTLQAVPKSPPAEVRLIQIPRLAKGGRWRVEAMRSYSSDVLLWFTRGQGRITVAGVTSGYGAHNAIFIPAGTMHGFEVSNMVFGTALFIPKSVSVNLPKEPMHLRIRDSGPQSEVTSILENMQREIEGDRPERGAAIHHHTGLLSVWLQRQTLLHALEDTAPSAGQRLAMKFAEMVEQHYTDGMSVAEYAKALGVTPTHLTRVCNKACGRPALMLLNDRLLFEARRRLVETDEPIQKVAEDLGFRSAAYFTRAFQHHIGCTPSTFRKQN